MLHSGTGYIDYLVSLSPWYEISLK